MEPEIREQLAAEFETRRDGIVEAWFNALIHTGYVLLSASALRERLGDLLDRIVALWLSEPFSDDEAARAAQETGAALASLHFVNAEALGHTMRLICASLVEALPSAALDVNPLYLRLGSLAQGVATGYYYRGRDILLTEQEEVRSALLGELQVAHQQLRAARDELEERVAQRTAELAQANADLHKSQEAWRSLVENAPDVIGTVDRDGTIGYVSRMPLGSSVPTEWAVGRDGAAFVVETHQDSVRRIIRQVFDTGVSVTSEIPYYTLNGGTSWYAVSFGAIRQHGQVAQVLFISRNIDEQKRLEQLKDNLIHDVSHELRTPLAKVKMSLELLQELTARETPDLERIRRMAVMASGNVDGLLDTVEAILDLSRLEAGKWALASELVRLDELMAGVVANMTPLAQNKGLLMTLDVEPGLPSVAGDVERLQRLFVNLIDNACKFSDQGTIVLAARSEGPMVHVTVADQGEGILPENRARVFERFFQERTRSHGVGIGLAMCQAIVDAHYGRIWVESQGRGTGTTFHLLFPVMPDGEAA